MLPLPKSVCSLRKSEPVIFEQYSSKTDLDDLTNSYCKWKSIKYAGRNLPLECLQIYQASPDTAISCCLSFLSLSLSLSLSVFLPALIPEILRNHQSINPTIQHAYP